MKKIEDVLDLVLYANKEGMEGICAVLMFLWIYKGITSREHDDTRYYVLQNMPERVHADGSKSVYGWEPHNWTSRKKWLTEHIKLLKDGHTSRN